MKLRLGQRWGAPLSSRLAQTKHPRNLHFGDRWFHHCCIARLLPYSAVNICCSLSCTDKCPSYRGHLLCAHNIAHTTSFHTRVLFYIGCPYFRDKKNLKRVKLTHTTSFHTWVLFDVCVCGRTSEHLQTVHIRVPLPSFQPSHHIPKLIFCIIKRD